MKFCDREIFGGTLHVMSRGYVARHYPKYEGRMLRTVMKKCNVMLHVGTEEGSSFIFVGTPEEYFSTSAKRRVRGGKMSETEPLDKQIGRRKVIEAYERISEDGVVVIVEGKEKGVYWNKAEYDADVKEILILPYIDGEKNDGLYQTKACTQAVAKA